MLQKLIGNRYHAAFLIFIVNLLFKAYHAGHTGLSYDENFSAYFGQADIGEIIRFAAEDDPNPPLYLIIIHYWINLFGDSEYALRMLSVLANSFAAGLFFLFATRFFNWQTGIFASLMFLFSNEIYYYSEEVRTYSIILLCAISSFYLFLSLLERPRLLTCILLGAINAILFYLHYVTGFILFIQFLLWPLLSVRPIKDDHSARSKEFFVIGFPKKQLVYLVGSLVVFFALLYPWLDRVTQLFFSGGKDFWLAKPTYRQFKDCIYEFFNNKTMFNVHVAVLGALLLILVFVKRWRDKNLSIKLLIFAFATGPLLVYLIYLAAGLSPIFLKRYVLFTLLGFMLLFAYTLSLVRINFYVKLAGMLVLSFFMFQSMTYPRAETDQYHKAAWFFKRVKAPDTFITNDLPDLLSYYYEPRFFAVQSHPIKMACLRARGVYVPYNNTWPNEERLERYRMIYYTYTFADFYDAQKQVETALNSKFRFIGKWTNYRGLSILVYYNPSYRKN